MNLNIEHQGEYDLEKARLCQTAIIKLNGEVMANVVEADTDEGYIVRLIVRNNRLSVSSKGYADSERLEGTVEIIDGRTGQTVT